MPHPREHQLTYQGVLALASPLCDHVIPRRPQGNPRRAQMAVPRGMDELPSTAAAPQVATLVGQLLLPGEGERRGVELRAWVASPSDEEHQLWVLPGTADSVTVQPLDG